jgi:hypothetical protein
METRVIVVYFDIVKIYDVYGYHPGQINIIDPSGNSRDILAPPVIQSPLFHVFQILQLNFNVDFLARVSFNAYVKNVGFIAHEFGGKSLVFKDFDQSDGPLAF